MDLRFSDTAIRRIASEDAAELARAHRKGTLKDWQTYGYVNVWRNLETGALQHSPIYRTRLDALLNGGDNECWVREGTQRVSTAFEVQVAA